jgi:hypothetical protein
MSEFAFFRFRSHNMLTKEEQEHKEEIVQLTEEVLQAKGIQCDASISKIPEEELEKFLRKSGNFVKRRRKNNQVQKFLRKRMPISTTGDKMDSTLAFNAWYRYIVPWSLFIRSYWNFV